MAEQVQVYLNKLNAELEKYPFLKQLEAQTKVPKTYLFLGVSGLLFICVIAGVAAQLIVNLVGFLYPAYASFKAIESTQKDDDTQWLTYWVVYAFFSLLEFFSDIILHWLPFYYVMKIVFLVYLMLPGVSGAQFLYSRFLRQFLSSNQSEIDRLGHQAKSAVSSTAASYVASAKAD